MNEAPNAPAAAEWCAGCSHSRQSHHPSVGPELTACIVYDCGCHKFEGYATAAEREGEPLTAEQIADRIIQSVCELDPTDYPEDDRDTLKTSDRDLRIIVERHVAAALLAARREVEAGVLVEFFRTERPDEGWCGDERGDSPEQCAIHVMRAQQKQLKSYREALQRQAEAAHEERERVRDVHLRRHRRLAAALGLDDGYSADATIDEAIRRAALAATQEPR